jgi:N-glycosylase/DNA lyase
MSESKKNLSSCILKNKHRFHNNKAKFIIEARKHADVKHKVKKIVCESGEKTARDWLVKNVKGFGYKEASHFLRNIGYDNVAILDRHIINLMVDHSLIDEKPKTINRNNYLDIESKFLNLASKINLSAAELDLYMWYLKTGEILK